MELTKSVLFEKQPEYIYTSLHIRLYLHPYICVCCAGFDEGCAGDADQNSPGSVPARVDTAEVTCVLSSLGRFLLLQELHFISEVGKKGREGEGSECIWLTFMDLTRQARRIKGLCGFLSTYSQSVSRSPERIKRSPVAWGN